MSEDIGGLIERIDREIAAKREDWPGLQVAYLRYLRDHLSNVRSGAEELEEVSVNARKDVDKWISEYEREYGAWIQPLIEN